MLYVGGWLGWNNLGDKTLYEADKSLFTKLNIIHYPNHCGRFLSYPNKILKPVQAGILAGGTLINSGGAFLQSFRECREFVERMYVFGTGVKQPYFWNNIKNYKSDINSEVSILKNCKYIGVRGPLSKEVLNEHGLHSEVIGDPVIFLSLDKKPVKTKEKILGINAGVSGQVWGNSVDNIADQFYKLAKLAITNKWTVKWFVVWPEDLGIVKKIAYSLQDNPEIICEYNNYHNYLNEVKDVSVFVGMKLHAVVLAMCAYVPSVAIEYRPKCLDFMLSVNRGEYNIRADKFYAEDAWIKVKNIYENCEQETEEVFISMNKIKQKQRQKADDIEKEILRLK